MISVEEATRIILEHPFSPQYETLPLAECTGRVLAETVVADRDLPPFHRVAMDGIAIKFESWRQGRRIFTVEDTQAAGQPQKNLGETNHCLEVMTGAMLPGGCDAVIRYEDVQIVNGVASVTDVSIEAGQSIHFQGADARRGDTLLEAGQVISPAEIALLASVGKTAVSVVSFPRIAVISTGDELVEIGTQPAAYQIRRSNTYALQAALRETGGDASVFHIPDEASVLEKSFKDILERFDVLIISGGVSRGKFDFVPQSLERSGVRKLFHQVSQRPGKPFWFGKSPGNQVIFALPGNPVSTFMCFYRYIRPWLLKSLGRVWESQAAILASDYSFSAPLSFFLQVAVSNVDGHLVANPAPGGGSGDFANLKKVTGFLELPLGKSVFRAGEVYPYYSFRCEKC